MTEKQIYNIIYASIVHVFNSSPSDFDFFTLQYVDRRVLATLQYTKYR